MKQPTRAEITQKLNMVFEGSLSRETVCVWAVNYIRNDEQICIDDLSAWHYLVAISNIDELITPGQYLFQNDDIQAIIKKYI